MRAWLTTAPSTGPPRRLIPDTVAPPRPTLVTPRRWGCGENSRTFKLTLTTPVKTASAPTTTGSPATHSDCIWLPISTIPSKSRRSFHGSPTCCPSSVSYTHLRAHETVLDLVCRLL